MSNGTLPSYPSRKWSAERALALAIYLVLVWGIAYLKRDYLWIVGDDPNLLQQSLLMNAGFVPNIDFFSGYPGLSLDLQALITGLVGGAPFAQHLYTALQATMLGFVFFWAARRCAPALVLLALVFVYSQGMYLNPTPNPGYLFEIGFVVGLKKTWDYLQDHQIKSALWAGVAFSMAFLSKQYGIFGLLCYFLSTLALLDIAERWRKALFAIALSLIASAILYSYFGSLLLKSAYGASGEVMTVTERQAMLFKNAAVFLVPVLAGLLSYLTFVRALSLPRIGLKPFLLSNLVVLSSFMLLAFAYLALRYGREITQVIEEIMILAPRRINSYLIEVSFSKDSLYRAGYGFLIFAMFSFWFLRSQRWLEIGFYLAVSFMLAYQIERGANYSATPFIVLAYVLLIYEHSRRLDDKTVSSAMVMLVSIAPLFLILIPYPNFAYHLPLLVFIILLTDAEQAERVNSARCQLSRVVPFLVAAYLVGIFLVKVDRDVGSYTRFAFGELTFLSADTRWREAIEEAEAVKRREGHCSSYGCRYLLLTLPSFSDYSVLIEKPIFRK